MPLYYNISGAPAVLDWNKPAVLPGEAVEVDAEVGAGLSPSCWSTTPPVGAPDAGAKKNPSNQSAGSFLKREPAPDPTPVETPDAPAAPAAQEAK